MADCMANGVFAESEKESRRFVACPIDLESALIEKPWIWCLTRILSDG